MERKNGRKSASRKPYRKPTIRRYGNIKLITRQP